MDKQEMLRKKFLCSKSVYSNRYELSSIIRNLLTDKAAKVISKKQQANYRNGNESLFPLDLLNTETWRTYDKCIDFNFRLDADKTLASVVVWDGDICYGSKSNKCWTSEIELPLEFISDIEYEIERNFRWLMEEEYADYLSREKARWIADLAEKILNTVKQKDYHI